MDDMVIAEKLQAFGLTRQEAAIYLCLCRNGTLTVRMIEVSTSSESTSQRR